MKTGYNYRFAGCAEGVHGACVVAGYRTISDNMGSYEVRVRCACACHVQAEMFGRIASKQRDLFGMRSGQDQDRD